MAKTIESTPDQILKIRFIEEKNKRNKLNVKCQLGAKFFKVQASIFIYFCFMIIAQKRISMNVDPCP